MSIGATVEVECSFGDLAAVTLEVILSYPLEQLVDFCYVLAWQGLHSSVDFLVSM